MTEIFNGGPQPCPQHRLIWTRTTRNHFLNRAPALLLTHDGWPVRNYKTRTIPPDYLHFPYHNSFRLDINRRQLSGATSAGVSRGRLSPVRFSHFSFADGFSANDTADARASPRISQHNRKNHYVSRRHCAEAGRPANRHPHKGYSAPERRRDGVMGLRGPLRRCDGKWMDWERCFSRNYGHRFRAWVV